VIGGGPAGLAAAIGARLAGLSVRVLECSRPPIDKACGEGLMPDAVARLGELGIELPPSECHRFRGIRYLDGEVIAEGHFPRTGGLGVRRVRLHQSLVERAAALGVDLCWGVAATGLAPGAGATGFPVLGAITDRADLRLAAARWVIGADGLHSRVRGWAGLAGEPARLRRFGVRRHFACRPWSDLVEVYWGDGCEAYVTPVGPEEVGVALLWTDTRSMPQAAAGAADRFRGRLDGAGVEGKASFDLLLARLPALAARLAGAARASRDRGAGPLLQRVRAVARGNVALVGDASGYVDAITGEGLAVALHQAAALVEALRPLRGTEQPEGAERASGEAASWTGGELARYAAAHRRIGRLPGNLTALMLAIERRPWLRRRVIRALAADPALFSRLLGIHARALPPARLGIDGALRLVYRLVTA
jgi:flavin-dependent dehydrogenase